MLLYFQNTSSVPQIDNDVHTFEALHLMVRRMETLGEIVDVVIRSGSPPVVQPDENGRNPRQKKQ
jgi:hypothetical protein